MNKSQWADVAERTAWTLVQGTTAVGLVVGWNALEGLPDLPPGYQALAIPVLAALLASIKGALATKYGQGSASTLPVAVEPVPAEAAEVDPQPEGESSEDAEGEDAEGEVAEDAPTEGEVETDDLDPYRDRDPRTGRFRPQA